jgi:hypothetical protein
MMQHDIADAVQLYVHRRIDRVDCNDYSILWGPSLHSLGGEDSVVQPCNCNCVCVRNRLLGLLKKVSGMFESCARSTSARPGRLPRLLGPVSSRLFEAVGVSGLGIRANARFLIAKGRERNAGSMSLPIITTGELLQVLVHSLYSCTSPQ